MARDIIHASDLADWYNQINSIRNKTNISLGSINVPNLSKQRIKASHINDLISQISSLYSNTYLSFADKSSTLSNVNSGNITKRITIEQVDERIEALEAVCANYVVESTAAGQVTFATSTYKVGSISFSTTRES